MRQHGQDDDYAGAQTSKENGRHYAQAGRPTEIEDTAGWLLARAAEQGKPTPTLEALYRLVRARIAAGNG